MNCGRPLEDEAKFCANCGHAREKRTLLEKLSPTYFNLRSVINFTESNLFTLSLGILILFIVVTFKPALGWLLLFVFCVVIYVISLLTKQTVLNIEKNLRETVFSEENLQERERRIEEQKKQIEKESKAFQEKKQYVEQEEAKLSEEIKQNQTSDTSEIEKNEAPINPQPNISMNVEQKRSGCATVLMTIIIVGGIIALLIFLGVSNFLSNIF